MSDIETLQQSVLKEIAAASDEAALEAVRIAALGKTGSVSALLKTLGTMTPDERKARGPAINGLKDAVNAALTARRDSLKNAALDQRLNTESVDVTLPVRESPADVGRIHPISQVIDELTAIFADMGFAVAEGPDIETDDYNFTKLNFPEGHPAREMHDTFYFNPKPDGSRLLLRTHTSPVQVRTMLTQKPPIRVIIPGRTYRSDSDQTHTPMFHQVEGLVIDKGSNLGHLKWILAEFCKAFFEVDNVNMRFRPSFFPFTEPSLEVDIQCKRDKGEIRFGEGEDWLEILGCGMVHPNVLRNCGLDPDEYQGFAWGMGIDRIAMLKYGMPDLRPFFEADMRWLAHYGFRPLDFPTLAGGLEQFVMVVSGTPKEGIAGLIAALTNRLDEATVLSYAQLLANWNAGRTEATFAAFQTLDTKSSGLLTHVSMMIAGLGIVSPLLAQHRTEEVVIVCEIIVYLMIAIGCLRCLAVRTATELKGSNVERELIIKHELYRLCNRATIYFTVIVFISFPIMLIWS